MEEYKSPGYNVIAVHCVHVVANMYYSYIVSQP